MRNHKLAQITIEDRLLNSVNQYNIPGGWDTNADEITEFKDKMKEKLLRNQNGRCAYCDLPLETRNPEIDHIAPKGGPKQPQHPECSFLPLNLVYACHNCNSTSCKGKINTVVDKSSSNYSEWVFSIVHPYLDDPLEYFQQNDNGQICVLPKKGIDGYHRKKAIKTIEMFHLNDEGKLTEIAKQYISELRPHKIQEMIESISLYRNDT